MASIKMRLIVLILLTLILTILPLPGLLNYIKPAWMLLLILYIQFYLPRYFHLSVLLILGLLLDSLLTTVLGQHVFALTAVCWLASTRARHFFYMSLGQQILWIGTFTFLYQLILIGIDFTLGFSLFPWTPIISSIMSMLLWPWLRLLGDVFLSSLNVKHNKLAR